MIARSLSWNCGTGVLSLAILHVGDPVKTCRILEADRGIYLRDAIASTFDPIRSTVPVVESLERRAGEASARKPQRYRASRFETYVWTLTAWRDEPSMRAFVLSGSHKRAMPKLMEWCDEAAAVHWDQGTAELPSWSEAHRRMVQEGRQSKVRYPSRSQLAKHITPPNV